MCPEVRFEGIQIEKKYIFSISFGIFFINFFIKGVKIAFCLSRGSLWTFSEKKFLKKFQIVGQSSRAYCYFFSARYSKRVYENVLKKINCFGNKILFINFFVLCDTSFWFFGKNFKALFSKLIFRSPKETFCVTVFFLLKNLSVTFFVLWAKRFWVFPRKKAGWSNLRSM